MLVRFSRHFMLFIACTAINAGTLNAAEAPNVASASATEHSPDSPEIPAKNVAWAGSGAYRVLLEVPPTDIGAHSDEMPAQVDVDWEALLKGINADGKADLRTIQVMQVDAETGRPLPYTDYAYQRGPYDRAFAWYDSLIPYDFPEVLAPSSYSDGNRKRRTNSTRRIHVQRRGRLEIG